MTFSFFSVSTFKISSEKRGQPAHQNLTLISAEVLVPLLASFPVDALQDCSIPLCHEIPQKAVLIRYITTPNFL